MTSGFSPFPRELFSVSRSLRLRSELTGYDLYYEYGYIYDYGLATNTLSNRGKSSNDSDLNRRSQSLPSDFYYNYHYRNICSQIKWDAAVAFLFSSLQVWPFLRTYQRTRTDIRLDVCLNENTGVRSCSYGATQACGHSKLFSTKVAVAKVK